MCSFVFLMLSGGKRWMLFQRQKKPMHLKSLQTCAAGNFAAQMKTKQSDWLLNGFKLHCNQANTFTDHCNDHNNWCASQLLWKKNCIAVTSNCALQSKATTRLIHFSEHAQNQMSSGHSQALRHSFFFLIWFALLNDRVNSCHSLLSDQILHVLSLNAHTPTQQQQ